MQSGAHGRALLRGPERGELTVTCNATCKVRFACVTTLERPLACDRVLEKLVFGTSCISLRTAASLMSLALTEKHVWPYSHVLVPLLFQPRQALKVRHL